MNYLAHLYLSDDDPDSIIGSLMGDFAKGSVDPGLPTAVRRGILIHRRIDSFSDTHPVFVRSRHRIRPRYRRYSGILIDLFYDHFLARDWSRYADSSLEDFAQRVYRILREHQHWFPPAMQRSMSYMVRNGLLQSYREPAGIARALRGIETRLKRPSQLHRAAAELEDGYQALSEDFTRFFPELVAYVGTLGDIGESD